MNESIQKKYLLQVKNKLLFHFTCKEIAVILEDLNQMFSSATENGETEAEVCSRLGRPQEFVQQICQDHAKDRFLPRAAVYVLAAIGIGIGTGAISDIYNTFLLRYPGLPLFICCLPAVLLTVFLWNVSGGRSLYAFRSQKKRNQRYCLLSGLLSFAAVLLMQITLFVLHDQGISGKMTAMAANVTAAAEIFRYLVIFPAAMAGIGVFCGEYERLVSFLMLSGSLSSAHVFVLTMRHYSGFFASKWYLPCALPYVVSLLAAIFWQMREKRKGQGMVWMRK